MHRLIATALAAASIAGPAFAEPPQTTTIRVGYTDLDLASPGGRSVLERRINRAVREVCPQASPPQPWMMTAILRCRSAALSGAQAQLAELYGKRQLALGAIIVADPAK